MQLEELKKAEQEFLELFAKKEKLMTEEKSSTFIEYINLIGRQEFEIFNLEIELKALKLRIKLAQSYLNRQEKPDLKAISKKISDLWKSYKDQLQSMMEGIDMANEAIHINPDDIKDARIIYRTLMKRLHPDLHPELDVKYQEIFIAAQAAYKMHDVLALRRIMIKYQLYLDDIEEPDLSSEKVSDRLTLLISQNECLKVEIAELERSFPLNMREFLQDDYWVKTKQNELRLKRENLEAEIEKKNDIYLLISES